MHRAIAISPPPPAKQAFTLVELAIVLVILGLLVGGVLAGQSLIRASELRSVGVQYNSYLTAVNAFRDKYFAIPGDMNNATAFWDASHAMPATCISTAAVGTATCNGDGNGTIELSAGSNEHFRFWQHLANAGLVEGSFSGITQGSNNWVATSANVPSGKLSSSLWHANSMAAQSGSNTFFDGVYGNILQIGGAFTNADPATPIFKPEELWNIDTKLDDGKPATGKLVTRCAFATCTDALVSTTLGANYLLRSNTLAAVAVFRRVF